MAFNIEAIIKNKGQTYNLEIIKENLHEFVPYAEILFDDGYPPFVVPHLAVTIKETDFGDKKK